MLKDSFTHAQTDAQQRARAEAIVEAESIIAAVSGALTLDADLLSTDEQQAIQTALEQTQHQIKRGNAQDIRDAILSLNHATDEFAARRMNRNIQRALQGKNVSEI
jgi:molecular chaperone HscA